MEIVYFDKKGNLAGIRWNTHHENQFIDTVIAEAQVLMSEEHNDAKYFGEHFVDASRIVGFITTKSSHSSSLIKSLQPIYFSVDEATCKQSLEPIKEDLFHKKQSEIEFDLNSLSEYEGKIRQQEKEISDAAIGQITTKLTGVETELNKTLKLVDELTQERD